MYHHGALVQKSPGVKLQNEAKCLFFIFLCFSFFYILIQFGCWRRFLFHQIAVLAPLNGHIYVVKLAAFSLFLRVFWGRGATISMQEKQVLVGPLFSALLANHRPSAWLCSDNKPLSLTQYSTHSMDKRTQPAKDLKQTCFPTCKTHRDARIVF